MATYQGSCHCGRVTFEFTGDIKALYECNCSICRRKGAPYVSALASDQVCILGGESELTVYQFGTGAASHQFCRHCGIHPYPPSACQTRRVERQRQLPGEFRSAPRAAGPAVRRAEL